MIRPRGKSILDTPPSVFVTDPALAKRADKLIRRMTVGYRSEVAYVIGFDTTEGMSDFIAVVMAVGTEHQREALMECCIDWPNNRINFYANDVKWYDSYEDVQAHEQLMSLAVERDKNNGYRFIRIGEDTLDIEERSEGETDQLWDDIEVHRYIAVNVKTDPVGEALSAEIPEA